MPYIWEEVQETRPIERNDDGTVTLTRTFKVWGGVTREQIVSRPSTVVRTPGPQPGPSLLLNSDILYENTFTLPDERVVYAYSINVESSGGSDSVLIVDVRYSNDLRLLSRLVGPSLNPYVLKGRAGAFLTADEPIPVAVLTFSKSATGGLPIEQYTERIKPWPTGMQRRSFSLLKRNTPIDIGVFRGLIQDEIQNVHQFAYVPNSAPEYLLFQGGDYSYFSPEYVMFTLFWLFDPGIQNRDFAESQDGDVVYPPQDKTWQGSSDEWVRPPYHRLGFRREINDPQTGSETPVWYIDRQFRNFNPTGGQLLIGDEYP